MQYIYFFILVTFSCFAQDKKLEVKINSITTKDINSTNRAYYINYQIENKTKDTVSFFLMPNALIANSVSSSTLYAIYKIYQNGNFEDMDGPFFEYETDEELEYASIQNTESDEAKKLVETIKFNQINKIVKYYKEYRENGGIIEDAKWAYGRGKLLHNIIVLNPNETKTFTIKTLWNKNKFIKNGDLEYYLDENNIIEIELILDLKTDVFKSHLHEEDLKLIQSNPNFIRGEFVSNKFKINFND